MILMFWTRILFGTLVSVLFSCSVAHGQESDVDSIDENGPNGGEERRLETFDAATGIYQLQLTDGIMLAIDRATQRVYLSNQEGTFDAVVTDEALQEAGISRAQFDEMISAAAPNYHAAYDVNGDGLQNDGNSSSGVCSESTCSPWTAVAYNDYQSLSFDRVQPTNSAYIDRSTACRDLRDYSWMGLKAAAVVGGACAMTAGLGCISAFVGLAYYTYRRQQAFNACTY